MQLRSLKCNGRKNRTTKLRLTHRAYCRKNCNGTQFFNNIFRKQLLLLLFTIKYCPRRFRRLRFKNVKHSDHGRYSCLISGFTEIGTFSKWRNFTLITYKRSEVNGNGKSLKLTAPLSLSHRKDGVKPKFINRLFMDNNVALLVDDILNLSCPFESKKRIFTK